MAKKRKGKARATADGFIGYLILFAVAYVAFNMFSAAGGKQYGLVTGVVHGYFVPLTLLAHHFDGDVVVGYGATVGKYVVGFVLGVLGLMATAFAGVVNLYRS